MKKFQEKIGCDDNKEYQEIANELFEDGILSKSEKDMKNTAPLKWAGIMNAIKINLKKLI